MSDSESEVSAHEDSPELSDNEVEEAVEEAQDDAQDLEAPEDDEDSDVTWEDLVRIDFAFSHTPPRGFDIFLILAFPPLSRA